MQKNSLCKDFVDIGSHNYVLVGLRCNEMFSILNITKYVTLEVEYLKRTYKLLQDDSTSDICNYFKYIFKRYLVNYLSERTDILDLNALLDKTLHSLESNRDDILWDAKSFYSSK